MPLGAVPALSWCGEVSLGGKNITLTLYVEYAERGKKMQDPFHV